MRQRVWHFHPITNHLTTTTNISSLPMTPEFRAKSLTCHLVQSTLGPIILSVVKKLPNCPWAHLLLLFSQLWIFFSFFFQFLICLYAPFPPSNSPPPPAHNGNVYFIHGDNSTSVQCFSLPIEGNYWIP